MSIAKYRESVISLSTKGLEMPRYIRGELWHHDRPRDFVRVRVFDPVFRASLRNHIAA
jgi:hypothetical protein